MTMTREETKEAIRIMQAYVDGKKIQYFDNYDNEWFDIGFEVKEPSWDWSCIKYRIAPDQEEPKEKHYRPYTMEEFVQAMHEHDGFVKVRNENNEYNSYGYKIIGVTDIYIKRLVFDEPTHTNYEMLCYNYVWSDDGTPIGKEVE